jgi:hypothetical protein
MLPTILRGMVSTLNSEIIRNATALGTRPAAMLARRYPVSCLTARPIALRKSHKSLIFCSLLVQCTLPIINSIALGRVYRI